MSVLNFPHKQIRAEAIREYIREKQSIVCFSCGNASDALRYIGLDVLEIGSHGKLNPNEWFTQKEIADIFPNYFDATCGHLPMDLMLMIAERYKAYIDNHYDNLESEYEVYCGSGETLVCLKFAYPEIDFIAEYNVPGLLAETEYNKDAPLNKLVELLAKSVIIN